MAADMPKASRLTVALILLAGAFPLLAPSAPAAEANALDAQLPVPLVGSSAVFSDGKFYVLGGRVPEGIYSDKIIQYDPATGAAAEVAKLPPLPGSTDEQGRPYGGRQAGVAVAHDGKIYYFGGAAIVNADVQGTQTRVPKALKEIVVYDPSRPTGPLNPVTLADELRQPAWGLMAASAGGRIYLFGGFTFDITNPSMTDRRTEVTRFDPSAGEGTRMSNVLTRMPFGVQDAAVFNLGGSIYLLGGLTDHEEAENPCPVTRRYNQSSGRMDDGPASACSTEAILRFDPNAQTIRVLAQKMPYRAQFLNGAALNGRGYILGARLPDGTASETVIEFIPTSATTPVRVLTPTLPVGVFGAPVATDGTHVYQFGGRTGGITNLTTSIVRFDPLPSKPWAPRAPQATPLSGGGVQLTWEPPAYDGDSPVTNYRIYRTGEDGEEALLATVGTELTHRDSTASPGVSYAYRITAVNAKGESVQAARTSLTTGASAPGAVVNFQAFAGNEQVVLRWGPPVTDGGSNLVGYRIYRDGLLIASPIPSATEHVDTGVSNERTYSYVVRAVNSAKGEGEASRALQVTPRPVPPAPSHVQAEARGQDGPAPLVRVTWVPPETAVDRFVVYRGPSPGEMSAVAEVETALFEDASVQRGRTYHYAVAATNAAGESPPSEVSSVSLVTKPDAPGNLFAAPLEGAVRLTWQPPGNTGDAPAESLRYYVSRATGASGREIIIATDIQGTAYTDRTAQPGVTYTYRVATLNPLASDPSPGVQVTPKVVVNKPPLALVAVLPSHARVGDAVQVDASQSSDPEGQIAAYLFDFGDGETLESTTPTVTHAYRTDHRVYTITLTVRDAHGATSEPATATLVVGSPGDTNPETGLEIPPSTGAGRASTGANDSGTLPGSSAPKNPLPGPGLALLVLALAGIAALARRK